MTVSAIVAISKNGVIGKGNQLPWYLPADLKFFKRTTINHHIIMGRKSFQSIGKPLPKRTNIVLSRNPFFIASGCLVTSSLDEALNIAKDNGEEEAFIIGGAIIYSLSIEKWDRLYLTKVDVEIEDGDAFFPDINWDEWKLIKEEPHKADEKNEHDYTFQMWERRQG